MKVAVITGGSGGIGSKTIEVFKKNGYKTYNLSLDTGCDVSDIKSVKENFKKIMEENDEIHVLVNSAGILNEDWIDTYKTNVIGTYNCCNEFFNIVKHKKYGKIINISSITGRWYSRSAPLPYTCTKYAVIGITRQLAREYAKYNINMNCVCPSQTRTSMYRVIPDFEKRIPLGRIAEPKEIAEVIYFLGSEKSSYMTGAIVDINGGQF